MVDQCRDAPLQGICMWVVISSGWRFPTKQGRFSIPGHARTVSTNERRRSICNGISHCLKLFSRDLSYSMQKGLIFHISFRPHPIYTIIYFYVKSIVAWFNKLTDLLVEYRKTGGKYHNWFNSSNDSWRTLQLNIVIMSVITDELDWISKTNVDTLYWSCSLVALCCVLMT